MRTFVFGLSVGVAVGAGGCYFYLSAIKRPESRRADVSRGVEVGEHGARRFGLPETDIVREFENFIVSYDYRTRNPKWVLEHITLESSNGTAKRDGSEFYPDPGVEPRFSAKLSDFRNSGYDRGHMAPAANHKGSQKAMDETFSLVNISPQVGAGFNRDYWARFEKYVKDLTRVAGDVYVLTGPLWLPTQQQQLRSDDSTAGSGKWTLTHDWIGKPPGLVAVPTHYFKVVVADPRGKDAETGKSQSSSRLSSPAVGAFVMPNAPIDPKVPLSAYVVPLDDLEQVAGTRFFPELLGDSRRREALDAAASGWRQHGLAQLKPFERVTMKQAYAALPASTSATSTTIIEVEATPPSTSDRTATSGKPPGDDAAAAAPVPSSRSSQPPAAKTPRGAGVLHVCDLNACQLPPTDFYLRGRSASGSSRASS